MKEIRALALSEDELNILYLWIDEFTLSRPKKNIARDFSDCCLVAEIMEQVQPRIVETHNYPQAHNIKQKFTNWNTLNRKVLQRLEMYLTEENIEDIVNLRPRAIENFLYTLKPKLENYVHEPVIPNNTTVMHIKPKTNNYHDIMNANKQVEAPKYKIKTGSNKKLGSKNELSNHTQIQMDKGSNYDRGNTDFNAIIAEKDEVILNLNETIEVSLLDYADENY